MTPRLRIPLIAGVLMLVACDDDPVDPARFCDDVSNGCGVAGFDLAIVGAEIEFDADQSFRDEVDAHVVEPGDQIDVRVHVVNRGVETAPAALIEVSGTSVALPSLDAGEERIVTIEYATPDVDMYSEMLASLAIYVLTETSELYDDADHQNNHIGGGPALQWHPRVPILEVDIQLPDTVRALHPYVLSATVTNHSPLVSSPDLSFAPCVYPNNVACLDHPDGEYSSTGIVAPGASRTVSVGLLAPQEYGVDLFHPEYDVMVSACFADASTWGSDAMTCVGFERVTLAANMAQTCDHPALVPPVTFESEAEAAACALAGETTTIFYVHTLDALEGEQYRFSEAGGDASIAIYDVEAQPLVQDPLNAPLVFVAPASERYYVVSRTTAGTPNAPILVEKL